MTEINHNEKVYTVDKVLAAVAEKEKQKKVENQRRERQGERLLPPSRPVLDTSQNSQLQEVRAAIQRFKTDQPVSQAEAEEDRTAETAIRPDWSRPERTPTQETIERIEGEIETFITNPALLSLMETFGYLPSKTETTVAQRLALLKKFSNDHWDFRKGEERSALKNKGLYEKRLTEIAQQISDQTSEPIEAVKATIEKQLIDSAHALGMIEPTLPSRKAYDAIVILGAQGMHPIWRTEHALRSGARAPMIVSLGTDTKIINPKLSEGYAPDAENEFDLMNAAVRSVYKRALGETEIFKRGVYTREELSEYREKIAYASEEEREQKKREGKEIDAAPYFPTSDRWKIEYYQGANSQVEKLEHPDIFALSTPSSDPNRRANTSDTYAFLMQELPKNAKNILLVTSSNFQPFQHFDAERMIELPYGIHVETIGFDTRQSETFNQPFQYLQEMNSAINSASALYEATLNRKESLQAA